MHKGQLHLRGAHESPGAAAVFFFFVTHDSAAADRAHRGHHKRPCVLRALFGEHPNDFRNHISGTAHNDGVSDHEAELGNMVGVVKRCISDGCAPHKDGRETRDRRHAARAAHLHVNGLDDTQSFLRRILVRAGPARFPRHKPQALLLVKGIHLVDNAVNFKGKCLPDLGHVIMKFGERRRALSDTAFRGHRKTRGLQLVKELRLGLGPGGV